MTAKTTTIPKMTDVGKAAGPEVVDAQKVTDLIKRTNVSDDASMKVAISWTAEIKEKFEQVDEKRKSFVEPLRGVIEEINAFFRPALDSLKSAEDILKTKVKVHVETSLAKRDDLLAKVQTVESAESRTQIVKQAEDLVPGKVEGMAVRESWEGEITDLVAVVAWVIENKRYELLTVDEKALKALTKAAGRDLGIPGWRANVKRTIAITPSRVKR